MIDRWSGPGRTPHSLQAFKMYYMNGKTISWDLIAEIDSDLRNLDIIDDGSDPGRGCHEWLLKVRGNWVGLLQHHEDRLTDEQEEERADHSAEVVDKWAGFPGRNDAYNNGGRY